MTLVSNIFLGALLLLSLAPDVVAAGILVSWALTSGLVILLAECFNGKIATTTEGQGRSKLSLAPGNYAIYCASGLLLVILTHNLTAIKIISDASRVETISVLNPWGIFWVATIVICCTLFSAKNETRDVVYNRFFRSSMKFYAVVIFVILVLVYFQVLPGNADKIASGTGGVGLANISTNETSLVGCCLLLWLLKIQRFSGVTWGSFTATVSSIGIILLTQSRIGIVSLGIILLLFYLRTCVISLKNILIAAVVVVILAIPSYFIISERMSADTGFVSSSAQGSELSGSGRAFMWLGYIDAFTDAALDNNLVWIYGVGPSGVIDLYENSPLSLFFTSVASGTFFPTHSDVVFIFLAAGSLGLLLWIGLLISLYLRVKLNGFDFCALSAFIIFMFYSTFDMLSYTPLGILLLSLAMLSPGVADSSGRLRTRRV